MRRILPLLAAILIAAGGVWEVRAAIEPPDSISVEAGGENVRVRAVDSIFSISARRKAGREEIGWYVSLFRLLNGRAANPVFDAIMPPITDFRRSRIFVLVAWSALVIFGGRKGRWAAFMLIPLIVASDQISSSLLKPLVARMRPCEVLGNVRLWHGSEGWIVTPADISGSYKSSFSFPSSHATNITAAMLFLGLVYRRLLVPLLVLALAVSYSRIYVGVHWPLDVAAGMAIGGSLAVIAWLIFKKLAGTAANGRTAKSGGGI